MQPLTNGANIAQVSGNTVGECLRHLVKQFPSLEIELFGEHGEVLCYGCLFCVNDEVAYLDADTLAKPVKVGDELSIYTYS